MFSVVFCKYPSCDATKKLTKVLQSINFIEPNPLPYTKLQIYDCLMNLLEKCVVETQLNEGIFGGIKVGAGSKPLLNATNHHAVIRTHGKGQLL